MVYVIQFRDLGAAEWQFVRDIAYVHRSNADMEVTRLNRLGGHCQYRVVPFTVVDAG
jgi:hypothetical protein